MKLHNNLEQGTNEWLMVRLGKFTASDAQAIASNGKGLETLVLEKVAESITMKLKDQYTNADIERGHEFEMNARNSYEIDSQNKVVEVGFVELTNRIGCSPDGFVGDDGLVEIKCKNDVNFVRYLLDGKIDPAHEWQMQMQMYVCDRQWVDYVVYNENFPNPMKVVRVNRDEAKIAKLKAGLATAVAELEAKLDILL